MKIDDSTFGRVSVLVLDYDPYREGRPSNAVKETYEKFMAQLTTNRFGNPGMNALVLANEKLVGKHQKDLEEVGVEFLPDWRNSKEYRILLRQGLEQNDVYLMKDVGNHGGIGAYFLPDYRTVKASRRDIKIVNPELKIDIIPRFPDFTLS